MRKAVALLIILSIAVFAFAGCNSDKASSVASSGDNVGITAKTISDLKQYEYDGYSSGEGVFIYFFLVGDDTYRAFAKLDKETEDKIFNLPYNSSDEELHKLIDPLPVYKVENLMTYIIPQDQLDALAGKNCSELFDSGWSYSGHDEETGEVTLDHGPCSYVFVLDGKIDYDKSVSYESDMAQLKVVSARYQSFGDKSYVEP